MGKFKVVITDREYESINNEVRILKEIDADVVSYQFRNEEDIIRVASDCDALIFQYAKITKNIIDKLDKCKVIAKYAIGTDSIDIDAATKKNICVTNVNEYCEDEVSTHALALLLALNRKVTQYSRWVAENQWHYTMGVPIISLKKSIIGVISFGKIARLYINKIRPLCDEIWVYDKFVDDEAILEFGVKPKSFEEIVKNSDYISIHAPLTEETRGMFNKEVFKSMKPTAGIINVARGPLVCEDDLVWALEKGEIAGAALDVLEKEPPTANNPLLSMENVIITPHVAWYSTTSQEILQSSVAKDVARVLSGKRPENLVNKELMHLFDNKTI